MARSLVPVFLFIAASGLSDSLAYQMISEPYSVRETFLRILGDNNHERDPLSRLDELLAEDPALAGLGRYDSRNERPNEVNGWDVLGNNKGGHVSRWDENFDANGYMGPGVGSDEDDAEYFDRVAKGDGEGDEDEDGVGNGRGYGGQRRQDAYGPSRGGLLEGDYGEAGSPSMAMDDPLAGNPMTTRDQEYMQHSSLWGHQYIQGGAGEGSQILKPDGSQKNSQELKTDAVLPAYCDPPNPCPVGYTAVDGCLEDFENTAAFSREYQEAQDCLCDAEHMFGCGEQSQRQRGSDSVGGSSPDSGDDDDDERNDALNALLSDYKISGQHKSLVAKKFHAKKSDAVARKYEEDLRAKAKKAAALYSKNPMQVANEFLAGEKLPIAAKKGMKLLA